MCKPRGKHSYTPCTHRKELKAANSAGGLQCTAGAPGDRRGSPGTRNTGRASGRLVLAVTCSSVCSPLIHWGICSFDAVSLRGAFSWDTRELGHLGPATALEGPLGIPDPPALRGPCQGDVVQFVPWGLSSRSWWQVRRRWGPRAQLPGEGGGGAGRGRLLAQSDRSTAQHVIISQRLIAVRRVNPV